MSEVHGLRIKELLDAKQQGRKVVGSFCVFVPEEIVLALDGISVGLCAGAEFGTEEAERYLPRNTCSLIKSFFGFTLEKVCPYVACCDLVVGEATCDGKKKAYEIYEDHVDRLYVMDLPQTRSEDGKRLLAAEFRRFATELEQLTGKRLEAAGLRTAIESVNAKRAAIERLRAFRAADPAPISGLDALLVNQIAFYDDPVRFTASVNKICDELEERRSESQGPFPKGTPRILLSGCPMAVPNWKLPALVERAGAVIVGEESCVGERGIANLTPTTGDTVDALIDNIVDRYWRINCAIFTPNHARRDDIRRMASDYNADGVIHYSLQFCQPYQIESNLVERDLDAGDTPVLRIDTDYGAEDVEQLRTRVEAFVESIESRA
jgi:benzoyl-CoA reductase/2-hydroxyglutaryl-CoA dehydratase subunit BcrC/BadD/HgdB